MNQIVIYGAGNTGIGAYHALKSQYEVLCFADGDKNKWGKRLFGIEIMGGDKIKEYYGDVKVVIASIYYNEILKEMDKYGLSNIIVWKVESKLEYKLPHKVEKELNERTINLGSFLFKDNKQIYCKQLTFIAGGSGVLDYMLLKKLAEEFKCREYWEIGSYIGESINILTDCCDKLYSLSLEPKVMNQNLKNINKRAYTGRLLDNKKITCYYDDSKIFDFSKVPKTIDLFFIDGDHSYQGVYNDTRKIFEVKNEDAIVVWHDFRNGEIPYRSEVICAVMDAIGSEFENVYVTDNNACGIYLPKKYQDKFEIQTYKYETDAPLYVYDTLLTYEIK